MIYLSLFITFFKIGFFGFGGGYAMLSLIQNEVVEKHSWISASEFTDIVAISQMTPGPIGINSATYVGYTAVVGTGVPHYMGILGAIVATGAIILPAFLLMLTVSQILIRYKNNSIIDSIFHMLRPAVVGLLAAAALMLITPENFGTPTTNNQQFIISLILFIITFIAVKSYKVNPILMILISGFLGGIIYS